MHDSKHAPAFLVSHICASGVISGKHYNRSVRMHKIVYEALQWRCFEKETMASDAAVRQALLNLQPVVDQLRTKCSSGECSMMVKSANFKTVQAALIEFSKSNRGPMAAYWRSYCQMVELLLQFIRSSRVGDWSLHLNCIRDMIPWMHSYDHVNYIRYLTVYWCDMTALAQTHPEAHALPQSGEFAVQRSQNSFVQVAVDMAIEQSLNRDSKTKGGTQRNVMAR